MLSLFGSDICLKKGQMVRRGIGVGHVQQRKKQQETMADLGAMMSAERIATLADQLDDLKRRLMELTVQHLRDIHMDGIVRAKFRQLAESLGVDFDILVRSAETVVATTSSSSSSKRLSSSSSSPASPSPSSPLPLEQMISSLKRTMGLKSANKDTQRMLACDVIECCIKERRYAGSIVPMEGIVRQLNRKYKASSAVSSSSSMSAPPNGVSVITQADVIDALKPLHVMGSGYSCKEINGIWYVQTVPGDTASASDPLAVLAFLQTKNSNAKMPREQEKGMLSAAVATDTSKMSSRFSAVTASIGGVGHLSNSTGSSMCKKAVSTATGVTTNVDNTDDRSLLPSHASMSELRSAFPAWPQHRLDAAIRRLMQEGSVWVDVDAVGPGEEEFWLLSGVFGGVEE